MHLVNVYGMNGWTVIALQQLSAHFFCAEPDSKYFGLNYGNHSALLL